MAKKLTKTTAKNSDSEASVNNSDALIVAIKALAAALDAESTLTKKDYSSLTAALTKISDQIV